MARNVYSKEGIYDAICTLSFLRGELSEAIKVKDKYAKERHCLCPRVNEDILSFLIASYKLILKHDKKEESCLWGVLEQLEALDSWTDKFSAAVKDAITNNFRKALSCDEEDYGICPEATVQFTAGVDEYKLLSGTIKASYSLYMMLDTSEIARAVEYYVDHQYFDDRNEYVEHTRKSTWHVKETVYFFENLTIAIDAIDMIMSVMKNPLVVLRDNLPEADYNGNLIESCREYIRKIRLAIRDGICNIVGVSKGADVYEISRIRRYLVSAFNILEKVFKEVDQKWITTHLMELGLEKQTIYNIKNELTKSAYVSSDKLDMLANIEVWSKVLRMLHGRYIHWLITESDGQLEVEVEVALSERNFWDDDQHRQRASW